MFLSLIAQIASQIRLLEPTVQTPLPSFKSDQMMFVVFPVRVKVVLLISLTAQQSMERKTMSSKSTTLTDKSRETHVAQQQMLITQTAPLSTSLAGTHLPQNCSVAVSQFRRRLQFDGLS